LKIRVSFYSFLIGSLLFYSQVFAYCEYSSFSDLEVLAQDSKLAAQLVQFKGSFE